MFHETFTATADSRSKRVNIEQNLRTIEVVRTGPAVLNGRLGSLNESITVNITDKSGRLRRVYTDIPLGAIAFHAQFGQGAIREIRDAQAEITKLTLEIDLAKDFGIRLGTTERASLYLKDAVVGHTYEFRSNNNSPLLGGGVTGTNIYKWVQVDVLESHKNINVDSIIGLVIPTKRTNPFTTTGVEEVTLKFANGNDDVYTMDEILGLNARKNDVETLQTVFNKDLDENLAGNTEVIMHGSATSDFAYLDCKDATNVRIQTDGTPLPIYQVMLVSTLVEDMED
ncbi:hypothetical protein F0P96_04395 [Hymenobacter busanensis]|uniref:Uncharacterized protein n=1 Tax=Hymenobacter busanensis TaxID=2607656 RepID=A0A7L4ZSS2_9BACT|nr:hypothetical protein [Hymenobacter busanensis]KAA9339862.1 hypothetical protein F0P96_04395 [Hymenobacter busanensis]QHJ06384.1 hypothetical protein GUY19_03345 [Hymenobacter busanensis]